jgi:hypothetical protein
VADVIFLERRGVPSAAICTDALQASANAMAALHGAPGYRYAIVPHPVSSLDAEGLRAHAKLAAPQVLEILRGLRADSRRGRDT